MKFDVMKAKIGNITDLENKKFIFEPKLDGYRALCYVNSRLKFISRNQKDITKKYPELDVRHNIKAKSAVLDGEIVAFDSKGRPSFQALQRSESAVYIVFDILMKNRKKLTSSPLLERKKILDQTVVDGDEIEKVIFVEDGKALYKVAKKRGYEGVMAKVKDGLYYPGKRSALWLKIKFFTTIDCVIVGYSKGKRVVAALALGLYDDEGKLHYIGSVGTGFTMAMIDELYEKLQRLKVSKTVLANKEEVPKDIIRVKPKLVAEVKFVEMTKAGILRTPVFLRLRTDKKLSECTFKSQL